MGFVNARFVSSHQIENKFAASYAGGSNFDQGVGRTSTLRKYLEGGFQRQAGLTHCQALEQSVVFAPGFIVRWIAERQAAADRPPAVELDMVMSA